MPQYYPSHFVPPYHPEWYVCFVAMAHLRARNFCFTYYGDDMLERVEALREQAGEGKPLRYVVVQQERCPTTKKLHLQGYAEFPKALRPGGAQSVLGMPSAHIEARNGTREQARVYCMEEVKKGEPRVAGPWEFGVWELGGQGNRNPGVGAFLDAVEAGAEDMTLYRQNRELYLRNYRHLGQLRSLFPLERSSKSVVVWLSGPTGIGKSHWTRNLLPGVRRYPKLVRNGSYRWWDGYSGQPIIVLDDLDDSTSKDVTRQDLKKLFDKYPYIAEKKGGTVSVTSKLIFCSSIERPLSLYEDPHGELERRIEYSIHAETRDELERLVGELVPRLERLLEPVPREPEVQVVEAEPEGINRRVEEPMFNFDDVLDLEHARELFEAGADFV